MSQSRKGGLIIAVVSFMAVMLGGVIASWDELSPEEGVVEQKPPFDALEEIYTSGSSAVDCEGVTAALNALKPFLAIQEYVPPHAVQTVTLPQRKTKPTISDLAIDRTMRLQTQKNKLCN